MLNWHSNPLRVVALMSETSPDERLALTAPLLQKEDAVWILMRQNQLMHEENQMLAQQIQALQNENQLLRQQSPRNEKPLLGKRMRQANGTHTKLTVATSHHKNTTTTESDEPTNTYAQTLLSLAVPAQTTSGSK